MELIDKSAQIIVHCLYTQDLTNFLFKNQYLLNKVNWKLWGGDLYLYRQVGSGSNSEENEGKRRSIIRSIAYITSQLKKNIGMYSQYLAVRHNTNLLFIHRQKITVISAWSALHIKIKPSIL